MEYHSAANNEQSRAAGTNSMKKEKRQVPEESVLCGPLYLEIKDVQYLVYIV